MADRVLIVGAGSFGTAVAVHLARRGANVSLYARRPEFARELASRRENATFLPGVKLPENVRPVGAIDGAFDWCFCAVPTRHIRDVFTNLGWKYPADLPVVSLSKGIEQQTLEFPTRILRETTGAADALTLSGPSHAEELARGLPCVLVSAGADALAPKLAALCSSSTFRVYHSRDLTGVELAGAAKNVVAIAAGMVEGLGLGDNAKAALLARGLAEIARLGVAIGAELRTFYGLSGLGDLYTTCASAYGRNRAFGVRVGKGEKPAAVVESTEMVAEGYNTAQALQTLARSKAVEMPICDEVCAILYEGADPREAVTRLMTRALKAE